jgi:hypothetical protein
MTGMACTASGGGPATPAANAVGRLDVASGTLPSARVGQHYSYRFQLSGGGSALWIPIGGLPLGLSLDPETGVLSGIPRVAGGVEVIVTASRGGAHPALGSARAFLPVGDSATGAASIWETGTRPQVARAAAAQAMHLAASGSVIIPAATVGASLYQAMYFQAVDNPQAPLPDLENVLLADVAAQVYATDSGASATSVESGLAALKSAFDSATNPLAPASAGTGLNSFGPTLVPELTGALGVMQSFGSPASAGVVGPAAQAVATTIYDNYLKTSLIATGGATPVTGITQGYAGFNDRTVIDSGDVTSSGFHALVAGPAITQAVDCGQASAACASVEDSLLTPVVDTGLDSSASVSVAGTPAQLVTADSTLSTMLSSTGLNLTLNTDGSLTLPAGRYDAMLLQAGSLNTTVTQASDADISALIATAGDPANPADVSGVSATDLVDQVPGFNLSLTSSLFATGLANAASPKDASSDKIAGLSAEQITTGALDLIKALGVNNSQDLRVLTGVLNGALDIVTGNYAGAVLAVFSIFAGGSGPDEAYQLAQQTDDLIQNVYQNLVQGLNKIQASIGKLANSLNSVYQKMEAGFADINFQNETTQSGLETVEQQLSQLQYQMDLTDADVVAFEKDSVQTDIATTINQCLDLLARNLAPLDFTGYSTCESKLLTAATADAGANAEEFATTAPAAPTSADYSPDGTVAATLAQHSLDPDQELYYLMSILSHWYGLGTDPATLSTPLVNPAVWSEVALAYRELLDEYPQYSAGTNPDLAAVEAPGEQVASLIGALQADNSSNGYQNPALTDLTSNYQGALKSLKSDISTWQGQFLPGHTGQQAGFGTPLDKSWDNYKAFKGPEQPVPGPDPATGTGDDPAQQISLIPACSGTSGAIPSTPGSAAGQSWEAGVNLPHSWYLLANLIGYSNPALTLAPEPLCYTYSTTKGSTTCTVIKRTIVCTTPWTDHLSFTVRFEGTDGALHPFETTGTAVKTWNYTYDYLFTVTGGLPGILQAAGGQSATPDTSVLDSEGTQILGAEQDEVYKWDIYGLTNPQSPCPPAPAICYAQLTGDAQDVTGAFELLELAAQVLAPADSLANSAVSDTLYGQDQLATSVTSPNGPVPVLEALAQGSGVTLHNGTAIGWTETWMDDWSTAEANLANNDVYTILNGNLASESQAAGGARGPARDRGITPQTSPPPAGDLATADAPALTYAVLDQLAAGQALDTDQVTVSSPGTQTGVVGTAASLQLPASSSAGAKITGWTAAGLPPGLSIGAATGNVTGTPAKAGTYQVTIAATDTVGSSEHNTGNTTFTWTVLTA